MGVESRSSFFYFRGCLHPPLFLSLSLTLPMSYVPKNQSHNISDRALSSQRNLSDALWENAPIALLAIGTGAAIAMGLRNMVSGRGAESQAQAMGWRVKMQVLTIVGIGGWGAMLAYRRQQEMIEKHIEGEATGH